MWGQKTQTASQEFYHEGVQSATEGSKYLKYFDLGVLKTNETQACLLAEKETNREEERETIKRET